MIKRIQNKLNQGFKKYLYAAEDAEFTKRYYFLKGVLGWSPNIEWDSTLQVFLVSDSYFSIHVPRKSRLKYYQRGVFSRLKKLINEYQISDLVLSPGDIILDIGSNIGELSLALARSNNLRVLAVEPEEAEVRALRENLKETKSEIYATAVWSEVGRSDLAHHEWTPDYADI